MLDHLYKFANHRSNSSFRMELRCLQQFCFGLVLFHEAQVRWSEAGGMMPTGRARGIETRQWRLSGHNCKQDLGGKLAQTR